MGYTTDFTGHITINPPLNPHEITYLKRFADTRRMHRDNGPYFTGSGHAGQGPDNDIVNGNAPGPEQPSLWCNWVPTDDGTAIKWNGAEKFYNSVEWMRYLLQAFLEKGAFVQVELAAPVDGRHYAPEFEHFTFDHVLDGVIDAQGEDPGDRWVLIVEDNEVSGG
ncbi:hypothetical protein BJF79_13655 [Actinomadura sp. CNU-125]|uniref:hypothetical protein n=1 Tax=Actinomadura sp. CNU-125 TaxID=1904961 RepID=UPI0009633598|nr:hypothetical protein [Actinomadura sp. CNU-125]OLT24383.1 hypothetical protein BJF79_13655 [Actinomadura sp. CNU-125]